MGASAVTLVATSGVAQAAPAGTLPGFTDGVAAGLHYVAGGAGEPLVLLPGWPQTWWEFRKVMPALAARYRVVAVDLPGTDPSQATAGDKKSMAAAVHALVRALGHQSVHVAGHDVGAMVAFSFAANHPAAAKTVTVIDVAHPDEEFAMFPMLPLPGLPHPFWAQQQLTGRRLVDHLCDLLLVDRTAIDDEARTIYADAYTAPNAVQAGNAWYQTITQDIADQRAYGQITVPMLGIASLASPHLPVALGKRGTDVRTVTVSNSGHFVPEEQPAAVVDAITALIG